MRTRSSYQQALSLVRHPTPSWTPRVLTASAATGTGIAEVWDLVLEHRAAFTASGEFQERRRGQGRAWMWSQVEEGLRRAFQQHPDVAARIEDVERQVENLEITPSAAARALLESFQKS